MNSFLAAIAFVLYSAVAVLLVCNCRRTGDIGFLWLGLPLVALPLVALPLALWLQVGVDRLLLGEQVSISPFTLVGRRPSHPAEPVATPGLGDTFPGRHIGLKASLARQSEISRITLAPYKPATAIKNKLFYHEDTKCTKKHKSRGREKAVRCLGC